MFICNYSSFLLLFFFFNDTATTEIYTLSLHDALPITGWQETTSSPRSSSTIRSTPWVDGCCGPMFRTIRSSSVEACSRAVTSAQSPPPMASTCWARRSLSAIRRAAGWGGRSRASPGRTATPAGSVESVMCWSSLPCTGACRGPARALPGTAPPRPGHRRHVRVLEADPDLEPQPQVVVHRVEVVVDREPVRAVRVVGPRQVREHPEPRGGVVAQPGGDLDQVLAVQLDGDLAAVADHVLDGLGEAVTQPGQHGLDGVRRRHHASTVSWSTGARPTGAPPRGSPDPSARISFERDSPLRILACSLMIPSISISGRGGQPGTYMSTGTIWSTPCTTA